MKRNYLKRTAAVVLSVAALTSLAACKKSDDHNSALDQTFEVVEAEVKLTPAEEIDAIVTTEYQIQSTMSFIGRSENALTADNALYFAADDKMTTAAVMSVKDGKAVLYSGAVSPDGDKKDAYVLNLPSTTIPFTYASNDSTGTFTSDDLGSFTLSLNEGENEQIGRASCRERV